MIIKFDLNLRSFIKDLAHQYVDGILSPVGIVEGSIHSSLYSFLKRNVLENVKLFNSGNSNVDLFKYPVLYNESGYGLKNYIITCSAAENGEITLIPEQNSDYVHGEIQEGTKKWKFRLDMTTGDYHESELSDTISDVQGATDQEMQEDAKDLRNALWGLGYEKFGKSKLGQEFQKNVGHREESKCAALYDGLMMKLDDLEDDPRLSENIKEIKEVINTIDNKFKEGDECSSYLLQVINLVDTTPPF